MKNFSNFDKNQLFVHIEHGIGKYIGMKKLIINNIESEYIILLYADNNKLYVPIHSLHLINHYNNFNKNILLSKLGNNSWIKKRKKILIEIEDTAYELLKVYAKRKSKKGFSYILNKKKYKYFCSKINFDLTKDQKKTIKNVLNDMKKPIAMDRLICGDVGFGKTEIAIRAAFLAVENKKQVAILVPTTILAEQHFNVFKKRFMYLSTKIKVISRFQNIFFQKKILNELKIGNINILIGTHKILQNNVNWYDLGLLIIDEEHRFGVNQKIKIKNIKTNIDILTLTATPIPRTLNMAINGIRDLSILSTPPKKRLKIKTIIQKYNKNLIRNAILKELSRNGQVYYIYNNVKSINRIYDELTKLIPEGKIAIGHGQMCKIKLKKLMNDFYHKKFNIMICTTIIETGIDISNANTIIIEKANFLGLSQLHQLRGRVGRSYRQGYAYFLLSSNISEEAKKRLLAILHSKNLGDGFSLSMHDLNIRGAGELLGKNQSGQINTIGFNLYKNLLKKAINNIKNESKVSLENSINLNVPEIKLNISSFLPETYIKDISIRLNFYLKISNAFKEKEIKKINIELFNKFGKIPKQTKNLLKISLLKQKCFVLGIKKIKMDNNNGYIDFLEKNSINLKFLINLIKNKPHIYKFYKSKRLKFIKKISKDSKKIDYIVNLLENFKKK